MEASDIQSIQRKLSSYPPETHSMMAFVLMEHEIRERDTSANLSMKHRSPHDLLLQHGTLRQASLGLPDWCPPMRLGDCFANAHNLALNNPNLTYVEGLAQATIMPTWHAWLEGPDGRIIDPTWASLDGPEWSDPFSYLGIRFDTDFVARRSTETGFFSMLHGLHTFHIDILTNGLVMDGNNAIDLGEQ